MKTKLVLLLAALLFAGAAASAQQLPRKVENVTLTDLEKQVTRLPHFGEKNLMIFYLDSEARNQNEAFTYEIEQKQLSNTANIFGFGIINTKDSFWSTGLIRMGARKRTKNNGGYVLIDDNLTLAKSWGLGDCDNQFVLLFVNKAGELVFQRKGELSEQDKADFYRVVDQYK